MQLDDLTGKVFGRYTVLEQDWKKGNAGQIYWVCACTCGTLKSVQAVSLRSGATQSCGCLMRERVRARMQAQGTHGHKTRKHESPEYCSWRHMKERCSNLNDKRYANYGGRSITVCARWKDSFVNFLEDMGPKPSKAHTLERENVDKPYTPDNCLWLHQSQQSANRTYNRPLTVNGVTRNPAEWARLVGCTDGNLSTKRKLHGDAFTVAWLAKRLS